AVEGGGGGGGVEGQGDGLEDVGRGGEERHFEPAIVRLRGVVRARGRRRRAAGPARPRPHDRHGTQPGDASHSVSLLRAGGAFLTCLSNQASISYRVCSTDSRAT